MATGDRRFRVRAPAWRQQQQSENGHPRGPRQREDLRLLPRGDGGVARHLLGRRGRRSRPPRFFVRSKPSANTMSDASVSCWPRV